MNQLIIRRNELIQRHNIKIKAKCQNAELKSRAPLKQYFLSFYLEPIKEGERNDWYLKKNNFFLK